tara:strand:- start:3982 stop:4239 length:258 start_codon:yes stop_codon:yes gene_type:complete
MTAHKDLQIRTLEHSNKQLEAKVKELETKLEEEISVKKSEVFMNAQLKEEKERREVTIQALQKLNNEFIVKLAELRCKIKKLSGL